MKMSEIHEWRWFVDHKPLHHNYVSSRLTYIVSSGALNSTHSLTRG